jgi:uncharacterized membrane protein
LLYLEIFAVMAIIAVPLGARLIADLLREQGVEITLGMKIVFIALLTFCWTAWLPATVYVAEKWGDWPSIFYLTFGMILLIFASHGKDEEERERKEERKREDRAFSERLRP